MNILTLRISTQTTASFLLGLVISAGPVAAHHSDAPWPAESAPGVTHVPYGDGSAGLESQVALATWQKMGTTESGIGYWKQTGSSTNCVIGLGRDRARELTGSNQQRITYVINRMALFFGVQRYRGELILASQLRWFRSVRNGKKVGLWIHVECQPDYLNPYFITIRDVAQRPRGSQSPPASWLE